MGVLLPFAIVLFYKGDGPKQRDEKNDRRISQRCTKVLGIAYGLVFFGFGIFALIYYFGYKDVMPEDLRRIDGTISEVVIEGLRGRKNHTSVLLIEYPQYCFFMPFIDETLEEESPITLYVSVSDYQRVVEGRALSNREQHTIDQYRPYVMAYESGKSHVTLSDYNEWSRRDSKWGLYMGIVCILFGVGAEIWFWRKSRPNSENIRSEKRVK